MEAAPETHARWAETDCPHCGRRTRTIQGLCPNCGRLKDANRVPVSSSGPTGSFWGDLDDFVQIGLVCSPLLVLGVVAIFFLPEIVLIVVVALVLAAIFSNLLDWW
jgi:hypothetical protein